MTLPGTQVIERDSPAASGIPVGTGTLFVTGLTQRGPVDEAVLVRNLTQVQNKLGDRVSYGLIYDALETFFREGGTVAYVSRVVGPSASVATYTWQDSTPADALRIDAAEPGDWATGYQVVISDGDSSGYKIVVEDADDNVLEESPDLADNTAAAAWSLNSSYIRVTQLGDGVPVNGTHSLAGGSDDRINIVEDNWTSALDRFLKTYGPGQVAAPGRTTDDAHAALLDHAQDFRRVALLDLPDSASAATLVTSAAASRALETARYGAAFGPWAVIPGLASGTTRVVPYSAVQAGIIARNDAVSGNPNEAAAGANGVAQYAIGLSQPDWTDADRELLNDAGVNVARRFGSTIETYGYRTLVDGDVDNTWLMFTNARLYMSIASDLDAIAERFVFEQIDGKRQTIAKFNGDLVGALMPYYENGSLFGETFQEAANVETGEQVNTDETIADRQLNAVVTVRMSPFGEVVTIYVTKVATTEAV